MPKSRPNDPKTDLDSLLTPEQCAAWLQMKERVLLANVRLGRIPVVKVNARVLRFHPRTILATQSAKTKAR